MSLNPRQQQILDEVQAKGELKLADLKKMFDVTEMTIRRDLEKLEQSGNVRRTFGGVIWMGKDITLDERSGHMMHEKIRIGKHAAILIQPGESVFIDGGSTTLQIARAIPPNHDITVVTNALNVAQELQNKRVSVIVVGGMLREATSSMVGPMTINTVSKMVFSRAFLGASGLTAEHGFSNTNMEEAELKRLVIKQSKETCVVMDHSKFDNQALFSFADLGQVQNLLTSSLPEKELFDKCEKAGLKVTVCE